MEEKLKWCFKIKDGAKLTEPNVKYFQLLYETG